MMNLRIFVGIGGHFLERLQHELFSALSLSHALGSAFLFLIRHCRIYAEASLQSPEQLIILVHHLILSTGFSPSISIWRIQYPK